MRTLPSQLGSGSLGGGYPDRLLGTLKQGLTSDVRRILETYKHWSVWYLEQSSDSSTEQSSDLFEDVLTIFKSI